MSLRVRNRFLAAFALWAGVIWLSAPFIPLLRTHLAGSFSRFVLAGLAGSAVLAVAVVLYRGRPGVAVLFQMLLLAVAGYTFSRLLAPPDARSRLVELTHFVEYGALGVLACFSNAAASSPGRVLWSLLMVFGVGLVDELFQWALASRYGEVRDVALNVAAGALGVGYGWVLAKDQAPSRPSPREVERLLAALMAATLALSLFLRLVHVGQEVTCRDVTIVSWYDAGALEKAGASRAERWRSLTQAEKEALLRPDQTLLVAGDPYATEGRFHVQRRNESFDAGEHQVAGAENTILERWYGPLLDVTGWRRGDLPSKPAGAYRSPVMAHLWPWLTPARLWTATACFELFLLGAILVLRRNNT